MHPVKIGIAQAVTYMVQTKDYIIGPDFIAWNKKIDENDADTLLHLAFKADSAIIADIRRLIFDPRSYGPKVRMMH